MKGEERAVVPTLILQMTSFLLLSVLINLLHLSVLACFYASLMEGVMSEEHILVLITSIPHKHTRQLPVPSSQHFWDSINTSCRKTRTSFIKLCLCNWILVWNDFFFCYKKLPFLFQMANPISSSNIWIEVSLPETQGELTGAKKKKTLHRWMWKKQVALSFKDLLVKVWSRDHHLGAY
jgi:hypothetical protein